MTLGITILGCGSSGGVPRPGQGWGTCDPLNPKNRRRRCSILVQKWGDEGQSTNVLVDTSPDLREQMLSEDIKHINGVLYTHAHADHTHGIDDIRPFVMLARKRINAWMDEPTSATMMGSFGYIFKTPAGSYYPPLLIENRLSDGQAVDIDGPAGALNAVPFRLNHGEIDALGYRFGDIAYMPDVNGIPDASVPFLEGLDVLIIDALRYTKHPSHFCLEETLGWIERVRPRRAILTNLHTDMDFETLRAELPAHVEPAYDGMKIGHVSR